MFRCASPFIMPAHSAPHHGRTTLRTVLCRARHSANMRLPESAGRTDTFTDRAGRLRSAHAATPATAAALAAHPPATATSLRHDLPPFACRVQRPVLLFQCTVHRPIDTFVLGPFFQDCPANATTSLCATYTYKIKTLRQTVK